MSNKKLYSADGKSCHVTKITKNNKRIDYGFIDMQEVAAALRQHGEICIVRGHGFKREEVLRVVNLWRKEIDTERSKIDFLRSFDIHKNCFCGED